MNTKVSFLITVMFSVLASVAFADEPVKVVPSDANAPAPAAESQAPTEGSATASSQTKKQLAALAHVEAGRDFELCLGQEKRRGVSAVSCMARIRSAILQEIDSLETTVGNCGFSPILKGETLADKPAFKELMALRAAEKRANARAFAQRKSGKVGPRIFKALQLKAAYIREEGTLRLRDKACSGRVR